jgi:hypothetical protein
LPEHIRMSIFFIGYIAVALAVILGLVDFLVQTS